MSKTITIRLEDSVYEQISRAAKEDHRPISNFITHTVQEVLSQLSLSDDAEMKEILSNPDLAKRLKRGHVQAALKKGRFVE